MIYIRMLILWLGEVRKFMGMFECVFDILYLSFVIGLGIQLLLQKGKNAKLFGLMGVILGVGDSFHLIPRIISHLMPNGFEVNYMMLSYGKAITSITMTVFYLIYYYFLKRQSKFVSRKRDIMMYILTLSRIVIVLMPQNAWGTMDESYSFALIRNVPFVLMGLLLVIWSYENKDVKEIRRMPLLISLSFIFYAPVVLWAKEMPVLGAFMLPKTVVYFVIVYTGYKNFMPKFTVRQVVEYAFIFLIYGLFAVVFCRGFIKFYDYRADTVLDVLHVHLFVLGFVLLLVFAAILLALKGYGDNVDVRFERAVKLFVIGVALSAAMLFINGMSEVLGFEGSKESYAMMSGFACAGYVILSAGLFLMVKNIMKVCEF